MAVILQVREHEEGKKEKRHMVHRWWKKRGSYRKITVNYRSSVRLLSSSDHLLTRRWQSPSACVLITSQRVSPRRGWSKNGARQEDEDREGTGGLLGGGECQTEAAAAERRQRKWGGSVPSDHFLGHGAWPPPSGANHSILDNFLKHLNLFPALQHPHDQAPLHISNSFRLSFCLAVFLLIFNFHL